MSAYSLSRKTLKHITAIGIRIKPQSTSPATRSLRLLLSSVPMRPPAGLTAVPQTTISTVIDEKEQGLDVTYSDKKTQKIDVAEMTVTELIRKMEGPARMLRSKEEGL